MTGELFAGLLGAGPCTAPVADARGGLGGAPMLGDTGWADVEALGRAVRAVLIRCARTGEPGPTPEPLVPVGQVAGSADSDRCGNTGRPVTGGLRRPP